MERERERKDKRVWMLVLLVLASPLPPKNVAHTIEWANQFNYLISLRPVHVCRTNCVRFICTGFITEKLRYFSLQCISI